MKNILYTLLLFSSLAFSQSNGITYQAVIYNPNGEELPGVDNPYAPLVNQDICLQFGIVDADGNLEYQEQVQVTTDAFGMVNLLIGTNTQTGGYASDFANVQWTADAKFLKVDLDIKGSCTQFEELSNQPFTYVPFAYYSPASDVPGPKGPQGPPGPAGAQGPKGEPGPAGADGQDGVDGQDGAVGATGPTGPQGPAGQQGPQGVVGTDGIDGQDGATGPQGPQGTTGAAGTNGTNGSDGADGNGISSTVDNGDGTFTITYTDNTTFTTSDFTGPTGDTGPQGPQGTTGAAGTIGTNGTNGSDGADGKGISSTVDNGDGIFTITYTDNTTFTTSDFTGPTGDTGPQGTTGAAGTNGTNGSDGADGNGISSTVDNGDGTFTITYTDNTTFTTSDFTGPTGATGPQGTTGLLTNGTTAGNTPYWNGTQWVVNNSNIHNNGAGVGIGTATPNASAKVEIASTTQGFLPPRMTTVQRDAITSPAAGLVIYNTTTNCLNFSVGSGWNETCGTAVLIFGTISTINCGSSTLTGTLTAGTAGSGVSISVPYTGGNAGSYNAQSISSTGVTGLTATLSSGTLATGNDSLLFTISGTPAASGSAVFALSFGGQSCNLTLSVSSAAPTYPAGSVFCASGPTAIVDVTNPTTGETWMDRNLGATQAATSSTDVSAYGDLYQWGRGSDGHQCRTSATTTTLSSANQPGNSNFILPINSPLDWRSPQNVNLWQGVNGVNNPCPSGYRLPTESELNAERLSWSPNYAAGAFASPLKLPMAGYRSYNSFGSLYDVGSKGYYWSSTVSGTYSRNLFFRSVWAGMYTNNRSHGYSVRCLKD